MDNDIPTDFELVVIGTGMVESIIAAAASRIGKKVLHVDRNDYYGAIWASFNMEGIDKYIINPQEATIDSAKDDKLLVQEGETILELGNDICGISDVIQRWHIPKEIENAVVDLEEEKTEIKNSEIEDIEEESSKEIKTIDTEKPNEIVMIPKKEEVLIWTQNRIMKNSRKFNLDIAPKLQFARGDFVELLISSNIARYSEYRSCSRVLTWLNGQLESVPCSRADVFSNTKVTVVEKRMLMKLLSTCLDSDELQLADYKNKTFLNYLKDMKLTPNLIHYVLYAISMSKEDTLCLEAIKNTKRFLNSLGRFGKTPFLYSMYGSGELSQAFCRLCAVFGGTYCLNRPINSLILNSDNKCLSVVCGTQRINADNFVIGVENTPIKFMNNWKKEAISRAIFITDKSILSTEKENLTLLLFPPENGRNPVTIIELGPTTGTCPEKLFLVHVYCRQMTNPKEDLKHCVEKLFSELDVQPDQVNEEIPVPNILWSVYFTINNAIDSDSRNDMPTNLHPCSGPDLDLDYDNAVKKAKDVFLAIYPESEFLPRAPDPEEIILCDEDSEKRDDDLLVEKTEEDENVEEKFRAIDETENKTKENETKDA